MKHGFKMMLVAAVTIVGLAILSGCSTTIPSGKIYNEVTIPISATADKDLDVTKLKKGTAVAKQYFGVYAAGDASVKAAAAQGGIKKIKYVDLTASSRWIVGLKTVYTTTVWGE